MEAQVVTVEASSQEPTSAITDMEEYAWKKAQTRVTIFSAQQYVENYLSPPFKAAGYDNLNFVDVSGLLTLLL